MAERTADYDKTHRRNLTAIAANIDRIYAKAVKEAAKIGMSLTKPLPDGRIFSFDDFPKTHKQINGLLNSLAKSVEVLIVNGIRSGWTLSNNKNNALARRLFGDNVGKLSAMQYRRYFSTNGAALDAFIGRKERGMNLSDRVWHYTDLFKREIELGLDVGIRNGLSASAMARELQQYLQHPDMLFRRIRDEHGNLQLSKAAKSFHPGRGVYRSSYRNARRLAVTETNMAYRTADHQRWQQMDFVVGIEVRLSGNHTCLGRDGKPHAFHDICDELKGRYPKDFKFTGWHPNCRCYAISILKTEEEMAEDTRRILAGEEPIDPSDSENAVNVMPDNFNGWVKENAERIERAEKRGTLPYFLKDNDAKVQDIHSRVVVIGDVQYKICDLLAECRLESTQKGKIWIHSQHGKNELQENMDIASVLANKHNQEIMLLPNIEGVKSADSYNISTNQFEEYKVNGKPTKNAIDMLLRSGAKQAPVILLKIESEITMEDLAAAIRSRVIRSKSIKEVVLMKHNCIIRLPRAIIESNGFKIQPEDFH